MFPLFDDQCIGENNCRVVCLCKWNVIVNRFFFMCDRRGSLYIYIYVCAIYTCVYMIYVKSERIMQNCQDDSLIQCRRKQEKNNHRTFYSHLWPSLLVDN